MQRTPPEDGVTTGPGALVSSRKSSGGDVSKVGCCSSDRMGPWPGGAVGPMGGPPGPGPGGGMGPPHGLKAGPNAGKGNWKGVDERLLGWDSLGLAVRRELDVHGPPYTDSCRQENGRD